MDNTYQLTPTKKEWYPTAAMNHVSEVSNIYAEEENKLTKPEK